MPRRGGGGGAYFHEFSGIVGAEIQSAVSGSCLVFVHDSGLRGGQNGRGRRIFFKTGPAEKRKAEDNGRPHFPCFSARLSLRNRANLLFLLFFPEYYPCAFGLRVVLDVFFIGFDSFFILVSASVSIVHSITPLSRKHGSVIHSYSILNPVFSMQSLI